MLFKIEQEFMYRWDHAPRTGNLYSTQKAAEDDIAEFVATTVEANAQGHMDDAYEVADYRVVQVREPIDAFSSEEVTTLLESARVMMQDADMFDCLVSTLNMDDSTMCDIRDRLQEVMDDAE